MVLSPCGSTYLANLRLSELARSSQPLETARRIEFGLRM